jgi:hypothetical protein
LANPSWEEKNHKMMTNLNQKMKSVLKGILRRVADEVGVALAHVQKIGIGIEKSRKISKRKKRGRS